MNFHDFMNSYDFCSKIGTAELIDFIFTSKNTQFLVVNLSIETEYSRLQNKVKFAIKKIVKIVTIEIINIF